MAVDVFLNLDDDVHRAYALKARLLETTVEELLRGVSSRETGQPYRRPSGPELLATDRPHLMFDLTTAKAERRQRDHRRN